jgi:hypothetical protein
MEEATGSASRLLRARGRRQGQIVEFLYFEGLSEEDVAGVLPISRATVTCEWHTSRGWLYHRMTTGHTGRNS